MQYRARGRIHDMRSGASKTKVAQRGAGAMRTGAKGSMTGVKHPKRAAKRQKVLGAMAGSQSKLGHMVRGAIGGRQQNQQAQKRMGKTQSMMSNMTSGSSRMTGNTMKPARPAPGVRRLGGNRGGRRGW